MSESRLQAESRFNAACHRLHQALSAKASDRLKGISFPTFDPGVPVQNAAAELESGMEQLLHNMRNVEYQEEKQKVKSLVNRVFNSSYPYVVRFLQLGQLASNVIPQFRLLTSN
jgi:hypothetical protein